MKPKCIIITSFQLLLIWSAVSAQTPVSGDLSGTWNVEGSPYLITSNSTVPEKKSLIINPGVSVIIGENIKLTVSGIINAVGTYDKPITIAAPNENVSWDQIQIGYSATGESKFHYCHISGAVYALHLINSTFSSDTMENEVFNCRITRCSSAGILAQAKGIWKSNGMSAPSAYKPYINVKIHNCDFTSVSNGIVINVDGSRWQHSFGYWYTYGNASPVITGNTFKDIPGVAFKMTAGTLWEEKSFPAFINNSITSCDTAILAITPYDVIIKNNIFSDNNTGIVRTGTKSTNAYFNCFYRNTTNFVGFPSSYGSLALVNRNNTPCDVGFNIYSDPLFTDSYPDLSQKSPCVDAGTADTTINFLQLKDIMNNDRITDGDNDGIPFVDIGAFEYSKSVSIIEYEEDKGICLNRNFPNPFIKSTLISYELPRQTFLKLQIISLHGVLVKNIVNEVQSQGKYSVVWNGNDENGRSVVSGIYFCILSCANHTECIKVIKLPQ